MQYSTLSHCFAFRSFRNWQGTKQQKGRISLDFRHKKNVRQFSSGHHCSCLETHFSFSLSVSLSLALSLSTVFYLSSSAFSQGNRSAPPSRVSVLCVFRDALPVFLRWPCCDLCLLSAGLSPPTASHRHRRKSVWGFGKGLPIWQWSHMQFYGGEKKTWLWNEKKNVFMLQHCRVISIVKSEWWLKQCTKARIELQNKPNIRLSSDYWDLKRKKVMLENILIHFWNTLIDIDAWQVHIKF